MEVSVDEGAERWARLMRQVWRHQLEARGWTEAEAKLRKRCCVGEAKTYGGMPHHIEMVPNGDAFHSARPAYRVTCHTCGALLHPKTTGPLHWARAHIERGEVWPLEE